MRLGQQSLGTGRWRLSPLFGEGRRERVSLAAGTLAVLVFSQWTGAVGSWLSALACVALTCLVARYCLNRGTHDRAHYRRAWQILAIAAAVKGVWTCLHLTRIQVGVEALWEQAASEGWGALGFGALTIGFYVFSILALGQDRPGSHRGPLSIDVLLLLLGFVSIPMLILPALRSVPGCSEPHTDSLVGLMALGAVLALIIAGHRARDFEVGNAWAFLKISVGLNALQALLISLSVAGLRESRMDWWISAAGVAEIGALAAIGVAAVAEKPSPMVHPANELPRPNVAIPMFAAVCVAFAVFLRLLAPRLLDEAYSADSSQLAVLSVFALSYVFLVMLRSYSEQSRNLQDVRQLQTRTVELVSLLDNINDAVATQDFNGRVVFTNRAFRELFGVRPESPLVPALETLVHPEDVDRWLEFYSRSIASKRSAGSLRYRGVRADGIALEVEGCVTPLSSGGITWGAQFVIRDVARQRLIEKSQRAMAQRLEFFVREMPLGCVIWDDNFAVQEWNESAGRIFGWSGPEVLHRRYGDFLVPAEGRAAAAELWEELCDGHAARRGLCENQTKDRGIVECEWFHTSLIDDSGRVVAVASMVHDLTERKNLERQLLQSQKMEAVGTLAGGIAHDFNNLLTTILGHVSLALMKLGPSHPASPGLTDVQTAAERGAELVGQLLRFSKTVSVQLKPVSLNDCVAEVVRLVRPSIDARIEIVTDLAPGLWPVEADSGQIEQALMNLVINARDAIGDDGRVLIQTANRTVQAGPTALGAEPLRGEVVEIAVVDNGCGMDRATQERVFDPFFSTKEPSRSAGLGLAMVFNIAKYHSGRVDVFSTPGEGSTFRIQIPRTKRHARKLGQTPVRADFVQGEETILFVDDEQSLRALGSAVLEGRGHTILEAADGQESVDVFAQHQDKIGLVVLDLTMPRKSGWEALEEMQKVRPDIPVIISSGYSIEGGPEVAIERGAAAFLPKPYRAQQLLSVVQEVLERRVPAGSAAPN